MSLRSIVLGILMTVPAMAWALPNRLVQEGVVLTAAGAPMEGEHDIRIRLYAQQNADLPIFDERHADVTFVDGFYAVVVGSIDNPTSDIMDRDNVWLESQ